MSEIADLLERFRRGPELVAVATTGASGSQLDFQPAPGKWSVRQIVCHLADMELTAAVRFRKIVAEDNPTLETYDPDAWAERLHYEARKFSPALENFRRTRAANFELLKDLPETAFSRAAVHPKRGPVTLLDILRIYVQHPEQHAEQIRAVREAWKQSRTAD